MRRKDSIQAWHQSPRNVWRGDQNPRASDSNKAGPGRATERSDPGDAPVASGNVAWRSKSARARRERACCGCGVSRVKVEQPATVAQGAERMRVRG